MNNINLSMNRKEKKLKSSIIKPKLDTMEDAYPLSEIQKGIWTIHELNPNTYAYNIPCAYKINGIIDIEKLKFSFKKIINKHGSLRTRIILDDLEPMQIIRKDEELCFQHKKIYTMSNEEILPYLKPYIREPFDLVNASLMRVYLFSLSENKHILLMVFHHIIFDGSSLSTLLDEFLKAYSDSLECQNLDSPLSDPSYKDFVIWQQNMLKGDEGEQQKRYWLETLANELPILDFPTDHPRSLNQSYEGNTYSFEISNSLYMSIKELSKKTKTSLSSIFLSVYKVLLYRYTKQQDLLVGTVFSGRSKTEFEKMIGCFINMIAIRTSISKDMSFDDLLNKVHKNSLEAMDNGNYPFSLLVKELAVKHNQGFSPVFQTAFYFQKNIGAINLGSGNKADFSLEIMPEIREEGEFELILEVVEQEQNLQVFLKYNPELFNFSTIERIADSYNILLDSIAQDFVQPISKLPIMSSSEYQKIVKDWNQTDEILEKDLSFISLFEEQVKITPNNIAINFLNQSLTYNELNLQSNRLAHYLQNLGVKPGDLVAIGVGRSLDLIISLVAVMRMGATYIPLDLNSPEARLSFILNDTKTQFLLT